VDILLKGRGVRLTAQTRRTAEHKLSKLDRPSWPDILRVEVEVMGEHNPRIVDKYHVQAAAVTPRRTFRAESGGPDVDSSLDRVVERLRRQISTYRSKRTTRPAGKAVRLESGGTSPEGSGAE
jgi:ribosomal subunit interface protein